MSSSELFRFRSVRPVQNKQTGFSALSLSSTIKSPVQSYLLQLANGVSGLLGTFTWLESASDDLATASDEVSPAALVAMLPGDWTTQVASTAWTSLAQQLADTLASLALKVKSTAAAANNYGIPIIPISLTEDVEVVCRLILVQDCISTLASDQSVPQSQKQLQTATDVQVALSFRSVALPGAFFSSTPPVIARAPGVTDLEVVVDEWNRYIPGELANVVNVLPGETLASSSRHMEETVQSQSTTDQQTTTETTENSQTSTNTLSSTATSDASSNIGVHGQVETSGQYGPTNVKTNLGAQAQFSKSSANTTAVTTSVETVARAVKTVSETITQAQTSRTTIRDTSREKHSLQNTGANVIVGQYRWLSEIHRVQLVSYPNRLVVEFEIPEPGAWLRYALANQPQTPWDNPDPGAFAINANDARLAPDDPGKPDPTAMPLQPTDITPTIAAGLAARWQVQGLTSPPAPAVTLGNSYSITPASGAPVVFNDNSMSVPDGYIAQTWAVDAASAGGDDGAHSTNLRVAVGGYGVTFTVQGSSTFLFFSGNQTGISVGGKNAATGFTAPPAGAQTPVGSLPVGNINTGTIPIYATASFLPNGVGITLNVTIQCSQIPAVNDPNGNGQPYVSWQISTFNTLAAAYQSLFSAHNQERDARLQTQSGLLVVGPPALNLSRSVAELKRLAIQNLLGQPFLGYDLLTIGPTASTATIPNLGSGEPGLNPATAAASSPVIQFFEQAFEWENIVYICYPYFWGGHSRWVINATSASADPIFDQFLNAGSVRLVVPARPGFEQLVNFFLYTSCIWGGQNPPGPNDPGYLSVADEIQAIQVGATDGTPIYPPWEVVLPTTLLWAGTDPTTLPTNALATIGPPPQAPAGAALTVSSSVNPSVFGQSVTFEVSITSATGAAGVPTGQADFVIDGAQTADSPVTLNASGTATCAAISTLTVGAHTVSINYLGDGTFGSAIANLPTQTVNQGSVSVAVTSSANPSAVGTAVSFTAVVAGTAPAAGVPSGQVNFSVDGVQTADSPVTLDGTGTATSAANKTLTKAPHNVTVQYLGDDNFAAGSGALVQTVR
jgi:hypothetical protein